MFSYIKKVLARCVVGIGFLATALAQDNSLEKGFIHPPASARPHTWWHWMNGMVTKEGITADLEAMQRVGIGRAVIINVNLENEDKGLVGPARVMSPQWRELLHFAILEADRLGIEIGMQNCPGWSTSGGPWIKPEFAMQRLVSSEQLAEGPSKFDGLIARPQLAKNAGDYYRDVAVLAIPSATTTNLDWQGKALLDWRIKAASSNFSSDGAVPLSAIIDLSSQMDAQGRLKWNVPPGKWKVLRFGHTPTGVNNHPAPADATGLECDKMNKAALDSHLAGMILPVVKDTGPLTGKVLAEVLIDSWEAGAQNWTPAFPEEFRKRRGYDLLPYLPALAGYLVENATVTDRFLWDIRCTASDLIADNYYGHMTQRCHALGLEACFEAYSWGDVFPEIQCGGRADVPMGEFWANSDMGGTVTRAASAAHTYGRAIVGAESFTSFPQYARWRNTPYSMKALGDRMFANGANRFAFHRYAHQPWLNAMPGMTMGPYGIHFERTQTWWEQSRAWLSYLARCQFLLRQGHYAADLLCYCGDITAKDPLSFQSPPLGYGYDLLNTEVLLTRLAVKDGRLTLPDGMNYRYLVLSPSQTMRPEAARKVTELIKAGATVVGKPPLRSPSLHGYPQCDDEVQRLAQAFPQQSLAGILKKDGLQPDFQIISDKSGTNFSYIHRSTAQVEIYFICNNKDSIASVDCAFRVTGKQPELWYPDDGRIETALVWREENNRTIVPLRFDPSGSVFVVFQHAAPQVHLTAIREISDQTLPNRPALQIRRASLQTLNKPEEFDVTETVRKSVQDNELHLAPWKIQQNNDTFGGMLTVNFTLDGQFHTVTTSGEINLPDGPFLAEPGWELRSGTNNAPQLYAWKPLVLEVETSSGQTREVKAGPIRPPLELNGPWQVLFPTNWGAPANATFEKLISWLDHTNAGIRWFSGTAIYLKDFSVGSGYFAKGQRLTLDLGQVLDIAEVRLNGRDLGILWKPPFRLEVTGLLQPGANHLEVKVTNQWVNRLIGDEQEPDDCEWKPIKHGIGLAKLPDWFVQNKPRPSPGRFCFTTVKHYFRDSPPMESGLIGPVRILPESGTNLMFFLSGGFQQRQQPVEKPTANERQ